MGVKSVTLYSIPYVVSLASILAVAEQVARPITSDISLNTTIKQPTPNQTVNRAPKQDRLPIHRTSQGIVVEPATG